MKLRTRYVFAALVLVLTYVGQARADAIFQSDFSLATGTPFDAGGANYSQIGPGTFYSSFSTNGGWSQSGQVYGWSSGSSSTISGVLLNEGFPYNATISHTIDGLTVGSVYTLSFTYWGDNGPTDVTGPGSVYGLNYTINGATTSLTNQSWATPQSGTFYTVNYGFVAAATSTIVSFTETTPAGSGASPIIGDVSVDTVNTPAPGSVAMLIGFGVVAGVRVVVRRRRRQRALSTEYSVPSAV